VKRTLTMLTLAAAVVAAALVPAVASAHHGHHHHARDQRVSGTVASFENGVLAIKEDDGTMITGDVTGRTEIECENENENENDAQDSRIAHASDHGGGDDNDINEVEDQNEDEDQNENEADNCGVPQLTPGAVVTRARLRDRHDNAFWKQVKIAG
jgi:hypothetical protein